MCFDFTSRKLDCGLDPASLNFVRFCSLPMWCSLEGEGRKGSFLVCSHLWQSLHYSFHDSFKERERQIKFGTRHKPGFKNIHSLNTIICFSIRLQMTKGSANRMTEGIFSQSYQFHNMVSICCLHPLVHSF